MTAKRPQYDYRKTAASQILKSRCIIPIPNFKQN